MDFLQGFSMCISINLQSWRMTPLQGQESVHSEATLLITSWL